MDNKTAVQIIDETVEAYTDKPRAATALGCYYETPAGVKCAVGRCLLDTSKLVGVIAELDKLWPTKEALDAALKPEYRGYPLRFWKDVQHLHDGSAFWANQRLSGYGLELVDELKYKWENYNRDQPEVDAADH